MVCDCLGGGGVAVSPSACVDCAACVVFTLSPVAVVHKRR
jgi:hypothetical protein